MSVRNRTNTLLGHAALLAVIAPMLVGPLAAERNIGAQIPGSTQPGTQNPVQIPGMPNPGIQYPGRQNQASAPANLPGQLLTGQGMQGGQQGSANEFSSIWSVPSAPKFSGFPMFPAQLPGYGNYPLPVNQATGASPAGSNPFFLPLAAAEPEPAGWPSWIRTQAKKPLPFAIDLGLLVRQDGRIWHRDAESDPYEPLLSHNKFASLPVGAEVETRGAASFEVLLHESSRVQARGMTALKVASLDEQMVHIVFSKLSWLRVSASTRTNRLTLPDGSTIEMVAAPIPAMGLAAIFGGVTTPTNLPRAPSVEIRRLDEPGWYGGRATVTNLGGADIIWTHAFGKTTIEPGHRVTLFLSPPTSPTSAGLQTGGTRVHRQQESVTCTSDMATEVRWCGAKIQLPKGTRVTFESLGGAFVEATKTAAPAAPESTANAANSPAGG